MIPLWISSIKQTTKYNKQTKNKQKKQPNRQTNNQPNKQTNKRAMKQMIKMKPASRFSHRGHCRSRCWPPRPPCGFPSSPWTRPSYPCLEPSPLRTSRFSQEPFLQECSRQHKLHIGEAAELWGYTWAGGTCTVKYNRGEKPVLPPTHCCTARRAGFY